MKVTITAPFGRVQVDVPPMAAMGLMLDAVRAAGLDVMETPPVPDPELIRYLTQENCGTPEGPGEAKRVAPEEGDDTPGNESGGVTAEATSPEVAATETPEVATPACALVRNDRIGTVVQDDRIVAGEEGRSPYDGPSRAPAPTEEVAEQESYKGFLYTRCEKCGKIKGYCSKSYIKGMRCECGHRTPFRNMKVMTVRCSCCGKMFKYHTNLTEEQFTIECLHCGAPVEMMLHGRTGEYVAY